MSSYITTTKNYTAEITFNKPLEANYPLASAGQIARVYFFILFFVFVCEQSYVIKAAKYLASAKRPVLLVGSQSLLCNDEVMSGELTDAVTKMGIPTFLSGMARGLLGQHNRVQCRHSESRRKALKEADVVILVCLS